MAADAVLSPGERERAAMMRAGVVREEFIVARGILRRLLGAALGRDPGDLVLEYGTHGKPRLAASWFARGDGPWFNVAHSRGLVLIALSGGGEVGVDVEYVDPAVEVLEIARSCFHPADVARIEAAPAQSDRIAEFYRCWTRKEAVTKADGRGLTLGLAGFATGADGRGERLVEIPVEAGAPASRFFVRGVDAGPLHEAALATRESEMAMTLLDLCEHWTWNRAAAVGVARR